MKMMMISRVVILFINLALLCPQSNGFRVFGEEATTTTDDPTTTNEDISTSDYFSGLNDDNDGNSGQMSNEKNGEDLDEKNNSTDSPIVKRRVIYPPLGERDHHYQQQGGQYPAQRVQTLKPINFTNPNYPIIENLSYDNYQMEYRYAIPSNNSNSYDGSFYTPQVPVQQPVYQKRPQFYPPRHVGQPQPYGQPFPQPIPLQPQYHQPINPIFPSNQSIYREQPAPFLPQQPMFPQQPQPQIQQQFRQYYSGANSTYLGYSDYPGYPGRQVSIPQYPEQPGPTHMTVAVAVVSGVFGTPSNRNITGTIYFTEIFPYVVLISGVLNGLPPGQHGFAISKFGDLTHGCLSTGDTYNPTDELHGNINGRPSNVGDLGNIVADDNGVSFVNKLSNRFSIFRYPFTIIGRAILIHTDPDDLVSQPDGNSGGTIACGVIGLANSNSNSTVATS